MPPSTPFSWFFARLSDTRVSRSFFSTVEKNCRSLCSNRVKTHLIAPPTSCPRLRATIHRARYFPRAPAGASDMMIPDSATYQKPVPAPSMKPPKIRYYVGGGDRACQLHVARKVFLFSEFTHPLRTEFAVAIVRGSTDGERHRAEDQGPLRS